MLKIERDLVIRFDLTPPWVKYTANPPLSKLSVKEKKEKGKKSLLIEFAFDGSLLVSIFTSQVLLLILT